MTVEVTADLTMCADCAHITANGVDTHDPDQREHVLVMFDTTKDWIGHIVVDSEQSTDFATAPCDTCGTRLAGTRYNGVLLTSASGSTVSSAGVVHDRPSLPTYDERADAVMDFSHEHGLRHAIQRLSAPRDVLICWTCDDGTGSTRVSAPRIPKPEPTGIAASMSRFD